MVHHEESKGLNIAKKEKWVASPFHDTSDTRLIVKPSAICPYKATGRWSHSHEQGMVFVLCPRFILVSFSFFCKVLSDTRFSMRGNGTTFPPVNLRKPTQMTNTKGWESQRIPSPVCVPWFPLPPTMKEKLRFKVLLKTKCSTQTLKKVSFQGFNLWILILELIRRKSFLEAHSWLLMIRRSRSHNSHRFYPTTCIIAASRLYGCDCIFPSLRQPLDIVSIFPCQALSEWIGVQR